MLNNAINESDTISKHAADFKVTIEIDSAKCIGCGECIADCMTRSLSVDSGKAKHSGNCIIQCGHCVAICPSKAVSIPEYEMDDVQEFSSMENTLGAGKLLETIKSRRSIRRYEAKKIELDKINSIIQAGRYTATAANAQANKIIFVQDNLNELKQILWDGVEKTVESGIEVENEVPLKMLAAFKREQGFDGLFLTAPAIVYIAANNMWDAGLAAQNMELMAHSLGLGMLYSGVLERVTNANPDALKFLRTDGKSVSVSMLLGYPAVKYARTAPRRKADVVWL